MKENNMRVVMRVVFNKLLERKRGEIDGYF